MLDDDTITTTKHAEKILAGIKGLRNHLQTGEIPILAEPAIWDGGQGTHSETCDVVITNQRLLGYYYKTFPRERLFLDVLDLSAMSSVTLSQKSYSPVFREIVVSTEARRVAIRTPRQKSEILYAGIRAAIERYAPAAVPIYDNMPEAEAGTPTFRRPAPVYGRQEIRAAFDTSPLAITLLFVGGIVLEVLGFILWATTHSAPTGLPLFVAGFLVVLIAFFVRRQPK